MKANELMIGDWVIAEEKFVQIVTLGSKRAGVAYGLDTAYYYNELQPILLTPEILEKNGFNKPQDAGDGTLICGMTIGPYKLTFQSVFGLPILTIENVVDNDNNHTCLVLKDEIYNVHELQHALRLLGLEKEIEL